MLKFCRVRHATCNPRGTWGCCPASRAVNSLSFPLAALLAATWLVVTAGVRSSSGAGRATPVTFELKSSAFEPGGDIPQKFTCDGSDASPALSWTEPPPGTQSFALIADDPDAPAGAWVHWVVYNLPTSARQLPEGVPKDNELQGGGRQGLNDFEKIGYGGPCPPSGKPHRYFFKLYALDTKLNLKAKATKNVVERAIKGHILAQTELIGRYHR